MADEKKPKDPMDSDHESQDGQQSRDNKNLLNDFMTALIHLQEKKLVREADMDKLLTEYPLSPEDHQKLQMLIERHLTRAFDYRHSERWDNAIVETERALLFSPLNNEIRLDLAEMYLNRSIKFGYLQKDLVKAGNEVRDALELEPENRAAKKFQKELKQLHVMLKGSHQNKKIIPLILGLLLILGIALFPQLKKAFQFFTMDGETVDGTGSGFTEIPAWTSKSLLTHKYGELENEFELEITETILSRESDNGASSLSISGYISPINGDYSQLQLELTDSSFDLVFGEIDVVDPDEAPLRKGEMKRFSRFLYLNIDPEAISDLNIRIKTQKKFFDQNDTRWIEKEAYASAAVPQGVFLNFESRFESLIEGYDRSYLFYDLRVNNKSIMNLSKLDLAVQLRNADSRIIAEYPLNLVSDETLPFQSKSTETKRIMFNLSKSALNEEGELFVLMKEIVKE